MINHPFRAVRMIGILVTAVALAGACEAATPTRAITLETLNGSGVAGTVSFSKVGDKTGVNVEVDPAGNLDMPAHIHPGTCDELTPQPKFPLENVVDGRSSTVVPATIDELFAGNLAVNIHKSNDDLRSYTACVNIR